jgi:hypothetical protein
MLFDSPSAEPFIKRYIVLVAFAFPFSIALAGAMSKILVRSNGVSTKDFYLGQDLTLAAISAGLVNLLDIAKDAQPGQNLNTRLLFTACYSLLSFFIFITIMVLHQLWEKRDAPEQKKKQAFFLGGVSNILGLFLLILFMWLKLRDNL